MGEMQREDRPFVDGAKAETRQRDFNALREAIRSRADHEEIERLWDKCERWIVTAPAPAIMETWQKDWNALRAAIRERADHEEIERLWDRCERWI